MGRQGEDDMQIASGEDAAFSLSDPACLGEVLTLGTVAISAGVVRRSFVATMPADIQVAAEPSGTASLDGPKRSVLQRAQNMFFDVSLSVFSKDIGDLERGAPECRYRTGGSVALHCALPQGCAFGRSDHVQRTLGSGDVFCTDVCVAGRGPDRAMAEKYLDGSYIGAGLEQMGGKGMSQDMGSDTFFNFGQFDSFLKGSTDRGGADGMTGVVSGKEPWFGRTNFSPVLAQENQKPLTEHNVSVPAPFSVPDMNQASGTVNVTDFEGTGFRDTHSGAVGGHQHSPVFYGFDGIEEPHRLSSAENIRQGPGNSGVWNVDDFFGTPKGMGVEESDCRHMQFQVSGTGVLFLLELEQELSDFLFAQYRGILPEVADEVSHAGNVIPASRGTVLPEGQLFCHSVTILSHGRSPCKCFKFFGAREFERLYL